MKTVAKRTNLQQDGFSILPGVFEQQQIDNLVAAISSLDNDNGVRSRGGVYAIRNLLNLSPAINELAYSAKVCSIVEASLKRLLFRCEVCFSTKLRRQTGLYLGTRI